MHEIQVLSGDTWETIDTASSMGAARAIACNEAALRKIKTGRNQRFKIIAPGMTVYDPCDLSEEKKA